MSLWLFFFFSSRRRHTRFDCDWSSDVCSSDLAFCAETFEAGHPGLDVVAFDVEGNAALVPNLLDHQEGLGGGALELADRKSVVEGKRVDLGGRRIIKKKKKGHEKRRRVDRKMT